MTDKQKIADLEKRVKALEMRPVYVPIPYPVAPRTLYPQPYVPYWHQKTTWHLSSQGGTPPAADAGDFGDGYQYTDAKPQNEGI